MVRCQRLAIWSRHAVAALPSPAIRTATIPRYDLNSGDSFYFKVREPYRFVNAGKTWCSYYLVIAQRR